MSQADEQRATNIKQSDDAPELAARLNDTPEVEGHFRSRLTDEDPELAARLDDAPDVEGHFRSRLTDEDEGLDMSGGAEGFRR